MSFIVQVLWSAVRAVWAGDWHSGAVQALLCWRSHAGVPTQPRVQHSVCAVEQPGLFS